MFRVASLIAAMHLSLSAETVFGQETTTSAVASPEGQDSRGSPLLDPLWSTLRMLVIMDQYMPGWAVRQLKGVVRDEEKALNVIRYVQQANEAHSQFRRGLWEQLCQDREDIVTQADLDPVMAEMNSRSWRYLWDLIDRLPSVTGLDGEDRARIIRAFPTSLTRADASGTPAPRDDRPEMDETQIAASFARVCRAYGIQ